MARNNSTSNAQPAGHVRGRLLANAQIIQFAPYLARKQERLLARQLHHSPIVEGDIRAWVCRLDRMERTVLVRRKLGRGFALSILGYS